MLKKVISCVLSVCLVISEFVIFLNISDYGLIVSAKSKDIADYTYTISPILAPFNEYFFVKTDNPDPTSFRFVDKSSKYDKNSSIECDWDDWNDKINLYEDIKYENKNTGRVNGGYIFKSFNTDGGEIVLQSKNDAYYQWDVTWSDTKVKLKLPKLKDNVDYLIDTYATKSNFFDNMDSVEYGFSSVCLYSGSYIRGEIYQSASFWSLMTSPHIDQSFYMESPYARKENKKLFASYIYPFQYDSLGFPSMMAAISQRLDSSSSYQWSEYSHCDINVTYQNQTKTYGGQGSGEGQGISADKIKQYFSFGNNGTKITLKNTRQLLIDYSQIKMSDDIPKKDALTWKEICDTVGDGSWVRINQLSTVFGGLHTGYAYLYKIGDGTMHYTDRMKSNGTELYWSGDMGYCSDTWVDGRYISEFKGFVVGAKFEEHPTSQIMLTNISVPQITYDYTNRYNSSIYEYERVYSNVKVFEKTQNALFVYDDGCWKMSSDNFNNDCADYDVIKALAEKGLIDKKYLDTVTLTLQEVKNLKVDRNRNSIPLKGFIYDGTAKPGTPYEIVSLDSMDIKVKLSSSVFTDNGKAQIPQVMVTYKGKQLKENTDYQLNYSNQSSKKVGRYMVTVEGIGNYTGTVKQSYTIVPAASSIKMDKAALNLTVGQTALLKATTNPGGAINGVTWISSNSRVATVANGSVKAVGKGTATITAKTSNGKTVACTVKVSNEVTHVSVTPKTLTMNKGETSILSVTITPFDTGNPSITWHSSNDNVVAVVNGKVTARSGGTATITAKSSNGKIASCVVTVVVPEIKVTLSKASVITVESKSITLTATVLPKDATHQNVTWESDNPSVATVVNGQVTTHQTGNAVITVTSSGGKKAICNITVKSKNTDLASGDVNQDGVMDIADSLMIARYDAGLLDLTSEQLAQADINGDGTADIADALIIARCDAELIEYLL